MDKQLWKPATEASEKAKYEDLEIIFSEMKERVQETVHSAEMHYQRSITILLLAITALTSIIGYLSSKLNNFGFSISNLILIAVSVILILICIKLRLNIIPHKFDVTGTQAKKLFVKEVFVDLTPERDAKWIMLYSLIKDYQARFDDNITVNNDRANRIDESIKYLYWIPLSALIVCLLGILFHLDFLS